LKYIGVSAQKTQGAICERLLERSRDAADLADDLENLAKDSKKSFFKKGLTPKEYASRLLALKNRAALLIFHFKRLAEDNAENREALKKFLREAKTSEDESVLNRVRELESALLISDQNSAQIAMQGAVVLATFQTILENFSALNEG
jgi:hypothetical protein